MAAMTTEKCSECKGRGLIQMRGISALCSCPTCGGRGFLPALATTTDRQQLDAGMHYPHQQGRDEEREAILSLGRFMIAALDDGTKRDGVKARALEVFLHAIEQGHHLKASESPDPEMMEAMP